ncbi:MAG: EAL and HDOD domain-containing protein [Burkholderiales bacterium]
MSLDSPIPFLGRSPISDRRQTVVGMEFTVPSLPLGSSRLPALIQQLFNELDLAAALKKLTCHIGVDREFLLGDAIKTFPRGLVVIGIQPQQILDNEEAIKRCRELRSLGFKLVLEDFTSPAYTPLLPLVDMVKLDPTMPGMDLAKIVDQVKDKNLKTIAVNVQTQSEYEACLKMGFDLVEGYYFLRPKPSDKPTDTSRLALLKLLGLFNEDAETDEIERVFKHEPALSFNLLRLVNSVSVGTKVQITTLRQAITVLGRRQLQRWLHLLLYTHQKGGETPSPLVQHAAMRGKLMELLAKRAGIKECDEGLQDRAFIAGILSLLNVLLNLPIEEIVAKINPAEDIRAALLERKGWLGQVLSLIEKLEAKDYDSASSLLAQTQLTLDDLTRSQVEALRWSNSVGSENA